jgi:hypothetical protein
MKVKKESVSNFTWRKKCKISEVDREKHQFHHQWAIKEMNIENGL